MTQLIGGATSSPIALDASATWAVEQKIRGFADFEPGWNFGEGAPFQQPILEDAISLNAFALHNGFYDTDAFPGPNGEVLLGIYYRRYYLEFIIEPDRSVTFAREEGNTELLYEEGLTLQQAKTLISDFSEEVWISSESSTLNTTMTDENADSRVSPSAVLAGTAAFQSSLRGASLNRVRQFADIYNATTEESRTHGRFSGASQQTYYRWASA